MSNRSVLRKKFTRYRHVLVVTELVVSGTQCRCCGGSVTCLLWLIHPARDQDWETMGFYITLCTVHTTQGNYFAHPVPCPRPVQCEYTITVMFHSVYSGLTKQVALYLRWCCVSNTSVHNTTIVCISEYPEY